MNEYLYYILVSFGTVSGLVSGIGAGLWALSDSDNKSIGRHYKQQRSKYGKKFGPAKGNYKECDDNSGILKRRMVSKKNSWTEFTCNADSIEEKTYIDKSRKKEEKAYRYVRRRSKRQK